MRRVFTNVTLLGALLLILFALTSARAQETTGAIQGVVKDPTGAVIPGAELEATSPMLIVSAKATSDGAGYYRFSALPPGEYKISATAPGFRKQEQVRIRLEVGKLLNIEFQLEVGAVTEVVSVEASPVLVDTTQSKVAVNIASEIITEIPKGRNFTELITFAPGARQEPLQAGFQIDGASDGENAYLVEGMDTTHIRTGGSGLGVPIDFVQEVQVKSSGFEAEYGGALGGVVTAITKRGGNAWHGSGMLYYRGDRLEATPAPELRLHPLQAPDYDIRASEDALYYKPQSDDWRTIEPGFDIGGYVMKDRLWFYGSYLPSLHRLTRTVNFVDPYGTKSFVREDKTHNAFARLDFSPTDRIRAGLSWNYAYRRWKGDLPSRDSENDLIPNADAGSNPDVWKPDLGQVQPNANYVASAYFGITPRMVASARLGYWNMNTQDRGRPTGDRYQWLRSSIGFVGLDGTAVPPEYQQRTGYSTLPDVRQTVFDFFSRTGLNLDYSYIFHAGGTHTFKAGYMMNRLHNNVNYSPFTSWVRPYWGYNYPPILETGAEVCAQLRAQNLANYGRSVCRGNFGVYRVIDFSTVGNVASFNHSLYFQDGWNIGGRVTLNLGVRFDREYLPSFSVAENIPAKAITFGFTEKAAPRLGAAWDVLGNGKVKVYGSWGLFYDIMKYEMPRGSFGGDYWHDCWYTLDTYDVFSIRPQPDAVGHTCPGGGGTPGTKIEEIDWRIPSNDPSDYRIDPDLKPMRQRAMDIGAEIMVRSDVALEFRYARKRLDRTIEDVGTLDPLHGEVYLIANPGFGVAERPMGLECPTCPPSPKAIRNYDGMEFRINKRWANNWFSNMSYTYSRLWGNYGGLTSTDESGRHSPNVNRYFDLPNMNYDAYGRVAEGLLPTDRPHTLKYFGAYKKKWLGMESSFGVIQLAYSGTPLTTELNIISSTPVMVENRGYLATVVRDESRGIWAKGTPYKVRTEAFTNTDFLFTHDFKLSKSNENLRATFELNITNLFNQRNALRVYNNPLRDGQVSIGWEEFFQGFDWVALANADGLILDSRYGMANLFQGSRALRLLFKVTF